jgi:hypothetical protein
MGDRLYNYDKKTHFDSKGFNFLTFLGYLVYIGLDMIGLPPKWEKMQKYNDCREEIGNQLDACLLMKKIAFLERSIGIIF